MELNFKDKTSNNIFKDSSDNIQTEEVAYFLHEMQKDKEIQVSSKPFDLDYLEEISKKIPKKVAAKEKTVAKEPLPSSSNSNQLNRIEQKQNAMLEILQAMPTPTVKQITAKEIEKTDEQILKLNLELFSKKLIVLTTNTDNENITTLLLLLQDISEHLLSNSFYIFYKKESPVKEALNQLSKIGMGDSILNNNIDEAEKLLNELDIFSKMQPFEQSYNFAKLMLDKGLLLNAITLLNEVTSMYLIESIKHFSKDIEKYITIVGEENKSKLYSRAKDFFNQVIQVTNDQQITLPLFSHHKIIKVIDKEITRKLKNIEKTWKNRGDDGLFKKYANITNRIRLIRNTVAHADMQISFKSIRSELKSLNDDFYYLVIKKNIFRK